MTNPTRFPPELLRGTTELIVLAALARERLHGYALIQGLKRRSDDRFKLNEGSLYPLLHRLESERKVRSKTEQTGARSRRSYEITAAGRKELARRIEEWADFSAAVGRLVATDGDEPG